MSKATDEAKSGDSPFVRAIARAQNSPLSYALWALTNPLNSLLGGQAIQRLPSGTPPSTWNEDFKGRRTLVVGTGPSLDRIDSAFLDDFDVLVYINWAMDFRHGKRPEYFFTTDIGKLRSILELVELRSFAKIGKNNSIVAPIFLDQWRYMKENYDQFVTVLRFDAASWRVQFVRVVNQIRLPLLLRYHPKQPDWDNFTIPKAGYVLPVVDHSSALTAVIFAAMNGASEVGLIGCDFSEGRAKSIQAAQEAVDAKTFSGAATEFRKMAAALKREGVEVINYSWQV